MADLQGLGIISILTSHMFTFKVGKGAEQTTFQVHDRLFNNISGPLHRMINGNLLEAQNREADLPDVDPIAFAALIEFAYSGVYVGAEAAAVRRLEAQGFQERADIDRETSPSGSFDKWGYTAAWSEFEEMITPTVKQTYWIERMQSEQNPAVNVTSAVFLFHTRVAALADKYLMETLRDNVICWLHDDLKKTNATRGTASAMLAILTGIEEDPEALPAACSLIAHWFAGVLRSFESTKEFQEITEQYSEIPIQILRIVAKYVGNRPLTLKKGGLKGL